MAVPANDVEPAIREPEGVAQVRTLLGEPTRNVPYFAFKYLAPERISVLEEKKIRFTPPACLNDLFDMLVTLDNREFVQSILLGMQDYHDRWMSFFEQYPGASEQQIEHLRAAMTQVRQDGIRRTPAFQQLMTELQLWASERIGYLSLSLDPGSLLMWSHYAAGHTGYVVGFDSGAEFFHAHVDGHRADPIVVRYAEAPLIVHDGTGVHPYLCVKHSSWSYEMEIRVPRMLSSAAEVRQPQHADEPFPIHLYELDPSSLQVVILGARVTPRFEKVIRQLLHEPQLQHVELLKAEPIAGKFGLRFVRP